MFQECSKEVLVSRVFQENLKGVSRVFERSSKRNFKGVPWVFLTFSFKDVTRSSKIVLRVFHGNFKGVSSDFQG